MDERIVFQRILTYALKLLSIKEYSTFELKNKLQKRFPDDREITKEVLEELTRTQVIDDSRLAQRYIEYRLNASPRSSKMLKYELLKKGINAETIAENIGNLEIDEKEAARKLANNKLKIYDKNMPTQKKKEKLARFLASRGFSIDIIMEIVYRGDIID